jgi:hypothetical protein
MPDFDFSRNAQSELFEGGYYSIIDSDRFSIAKVLKVEPDKVHVRIYQQHFAERPRSIDPSVLTLGTIFDKDNLGINHLPLRLETFMQHKPLFLTYVEVQPNELNGYNLWKETANGTVFE